MVDFLVIGPFGSVTYKEFFPLIRDGIVRLGHSRVCEFSDGSKFGNTIWFSTISDYFPPELDLKKQYNEDDYPRYDNYEAIIVERTEDIPVDYNGMMGVPITFLEKWNPEQFDVIGLFCDKRNCSYLINGEPRYIDEGHKNFMGPVIDGKAMYDRLLIRRKLS